MKYSQVFVIWPFLNVILLPSKFVYFQWKNENEKTHCCRQEVTCSCQKCYVICGHIIVYDMKLSTEKQLRHIIVLGKAH